MLPENQSWSTLLVIYPGKFQAPYNSLLQATVAVKRHAPLILSQGKYSRVIILGHLGNLFIVIKKFPSQIGSVESHEGGARDSPEHHVGLVEDKVDVDWRCLAIIAHALQFVRLSNL